MADEKETYTKDEFAAMVKERDALKAKNGELLGEKAKLKDSLKVFDGIDPNDYRAMREAADKAEQDRAKKEGDWVAREKQLTEAQTKALEAKELRIGKLAKAVDRNVKRGTLASAIAKAGGNADLLMPHAEAAAEVIETEEGFVLQIKDEKGQAIDADAFVTQTLKTKYPEAFPGTGSSGGGAARSHAGGGGKRIIPAGAQWSKQDIDDIASGKAEAMM